MIYTFSVNEKTKTDSNIQCSSFQTYSGLQTATIHKTQGRALNMVTGSEKHNQQYLHLETLPNSKKHV
jgi:hypothetical protein